MIYLYEFYAEQEGAEVAGVFIADEKDIADAIGKKFTHEIFELTLTEDNFNKTPIEVEDVADFGTLFEGQEELMTLAGVNPLQHIKK